MPTYDYQCKSCGHRFEAFHRISELLTECPVCSGKVEKLIGTGIGLIFKGSGFYITDYKNNSDKKTKSDTNTKSESKPEKKNGTQDNKNGAEKKESGK
jgi:putative FmdB family regulatory protein